MDSRRTLKRHRCSAVPPLSENICGRKGSANSLYLRSFRRCRVAAAARPRLHSRGQLRAIPRRWRISGGTAKQPADSGSLRARPQAHLRPNMSPMEIRSRDRTIIRESGSRLHSGEQHYGRLLHVSHRARRRLVALKSREMGRISVRPTQTKNRNSSATKVGRTAFTLATLERNEVAKLAWNPRLSRVECK